VFSILGINLFSGLIHYRCRLTQTPVNGDWIADPTDLRLCGGYHTCAVACGSLYDYNKTVLYNVIDFGRDSYFANFNWGITNFDYIWTAFLTIFECTTIDGWTTLLYMIGDSYSYAFSAIFFSLCIIICNYFILNLTVAVMLQHFITFQNTPDKLYGQIKKTYGDENLDFNLSLKDLKHK
jgi:hypothetical protein